jgi:hypothetical protein
LWSDRNRVVRAVWNPEPVVASLLEGGIPWPESIEPFRRIRGFYRLSQFVDAVDDRYLEIGAQRPGLLDPDPWVSTRIGY